MKGTLWRVFVEGVCGVEFVEGRLWRVVCGGSLWRVVCGEKFVEGSLYSVV